VLLHLVRHAPSRQEPARPAEEWGLTEEAAAAAAQLRSSGVIPERATWYSSAEPKAALTAELLTTGAVTVDPRLGEQKRAAVWFDDEREYTACVERAFAEPDRPATQGWEPLNSTRDRVTAAMREIVSRTEGPVVAVGHGTAWTLLVAELTGSAPDLAAWQAMSMPDHCLVDLRTGTVASPWGRWRR
jgi:broad specificity phosphatase PhoE